MARTLFIDKAKEDVRALVAEDEQVAREGLRIAKQLESSASLGTRCARRATSGHSRNRTAARSGSTTLAAGRRRSHAIRYRLLCRIERDEGSPETVVVMALGVKPRVYRDATARAATRMREQEGSPTAEPVKRSSRFVITRQSGSIVVTTIVRRVTP